MNDTVRSKSKKTESSFDLDVRIADLCSIKGVAHDIRTPLSIIQGFLNLSESELSSNLIPVMAFCNEITSETNYSFRFAHDQLSCKEHNVNFASASCVKEVKNDLFSHFYELSRGFIASVKNILKRDEEVFSKSDEIYTCISNQLSNLDLFSSSLLSQEVKCTSVREMKNIIENFSSYACALSGFRSEVCFSDEKEVLDIHPASVVRIFQNSLDNAVRYSNKVNISGHNHSLTNSGKPAYSVSISNSLPEGYAPIKTSDGLFVSDSDKFRNPRGSGTGMYNIKSLVSSSGGDFSAGVDGDVFKVNLLIPIYSK